MEEVKLLLEHTSANKKHNYIFKIYIGKSMSEVKKILNVYGDRGWNESNWKYSNQSILRGYGALSAYLEEMQIANKEMIVHSVSFSILDIDSNKTIFMHVLYSGHIKDILNGDMDDGIALHNEMDNEDRNYKEVNEYDSNGYNKLIRLML